MLLVPFLIAMLAIVDAQGTQHPFVGTWTANMQKSRLSPSFTFTGATLQIDVAGDSITMASRLVMPSGQERRAAETFRTDGTVTPGTTPGVTLVARWLDRLVLAMLAKKDGQIVEIAIHEVSADGTTLTSRVSGNIEQTIVLERSK